MTIKEKIECFEEFCGTLAITHDPPSVETIKDFIDDLGFVQMLKEAQEMLYRCQAPATASTRLGDEIGKLLEEFENNT